MNGQRPLTPAERDRALGLLRRLTAGSALAGVAAIAGFGTIAALTFPGHSTTTVNAVGSVGGTTTSSVSSTSGTSASTTDSKATSTATPAPALQAATAPTTVSGRGQVSTGGS